jgi:L-lysine 2,3-aminomutase
VLKVPWEWKSFWPHPVDLLGDVGQWKLILVRLEIVLINTQDRCSVLCRPCNRLGNHFGHNDGTPR